MSAASRKINWTYDIGGMRNVTSRFPLCNARQSLLEVADSRQSHTRSVARSIAGYPGSKGTSVSHLPPDLKHSVSTHTFHQIRFWIPVAVIIRTDDHRGKVHMCRFWGTQIANQPDIDQRDSQCHTLSIFLCCFIQSTGLGTDFIYLNIAGGLPATISVTEDGPPGGHIISVSSIGPVFGANIGCLGIEEEAVALL
ncbi:hypothetical protein OPQ81_007383 [Rhizoctonia solani]|nr:hypothetical protein OPQ81_007383 [Rhizoctonia solani]